jgi:hypothetical protein
VKGREQTVKFTKLHPLLLVLVFILFLLVSSYAPVHAVSFGWSNTTIVGNEDQDFEPEVTAEFTVDGGELGVVLKYTGWKGDFDDQSLVLTGLLFDLVGFGGTLTATSAKIDTDSTLVGVGSDTWPGGDDLSGQWAFKTGISTSLPILGSGLSYGVGTVGDIVYGEDTFGRKDIIDSLSTFQNPAPAGTDFGVVPMAFGITLNPDGPDNPDGFAKQGPYVADAMKFTFSYNGTLSEDMIVDALPLFGSDGAPVPEPSTMLLIGTGLIGLAGFRRRFRKYLDAIG